MEVVYSDDCLLHNPSKELTRGEWKAYTESPSRLVSIKQFIDKNPEFKVVAPDDYTIEPILAVHKKDYVDFLSTIYKDWVMAGLPKDTVVSEIFGHWSMVGHLGSEEWRKMALKTPSGRIGLYSFDLSVSFDKDTWLSTYTSAQIVLSAAHRLLRQAQSNVPVYALCRPPGHHAAHDVAGGYCFINNVAVAAKFLQNYDAAEMDRLVSKAKEKQSLVEPAILNTKRRILIVDVDYHHGNGTQSIFYNDPSVFYISLHGSPDYPYFTGSEAEIGSGDGVGYNLNVPLDPVTTTDSIYLDSLQKALSKQQVVEFNADIVICSLGLDTWHEDPVGGIDGLVDPLTYGAIGRLLKTSASCVNRPVLFVQEGGYTIDKLGELAVKVLLGYLEPSN
ncbi:hypothetical protein CLU79DRAFT_849249 [Phycomyces nitens]|nr:hypothetical protein CLU79DRAFT_849249 [Phycomyces nitens]